MEASVVFNDVILGCRDVLTFDVIPSSAYLTHHSLVCVGDVDVARTADVIGEGVAAAVAAAVLRVQELLCLTWGVRLPLASGRRNTPHFGFLSCIFTHFSM